MKGQYGWLNVLLAPLTGLGMAEAQGGGTGGTGSAQGGEAPNPAAAPADRPTSDSPMTIGGRVYSAAEVAAAADPAKGGDGKPPEGGAAGEKAKDAPKPGQLMVDGKPVRDGEYIPRDRYNTTVQQLRETRIAAGLDPDTGKPVAKAQDGGSGGAGAGGGDKPQEFAKGQEPWAKELVALPRQDDKDDKGQEKYPDTASYLEALAEAKAHNKVVEHLGRQALKEATAAQEREKQQQTRQDNALLHTFTTEKIPAALKARGLVEEGALPHQVQAAFDAALAPLTALPPMERQSTFLYNFALKNAKSGPDLLIAVAEEAKTPEGAAHIIKLGALSDNDLISELIAMDRLVSLGFTIQGKPRAAPKAKALTARQEGGNDENISPTPGSNGTGSAVDLGTLSGEAYFKHLEAEQKAHNERVLKRISGNRN